MHSCQSCTKSFSRKDSLLRHQRQFCSVIVPRRRGPLNHIGSNKKSNNPVDLSNLDLIQIVTGMLTEQQRRRRKDCEKLKNALVESNNTSNDNDSLDDEEHENSDDDDQHSSSD